MPTAHEPDAAAAASSRAGPADSRAVVVVAERTSFQTTEGYEATSTLEDM